MRVGILARVLGTSALLAIYASQAWPAPCVAPPVSPEAIVRFKAAPRDLVAPNSDTRTIETSIRDLARTDPSLAPELVRLAQGAIPRFQTAIAAGLAEAAIACTNVDQQAGLLIQQALAGYDNGQFQASFEAVAGDLSTAATDAAASSAGSVIIVNPNTGGKAATNLGGGSTALVQITSGVVAVNQANTASTTAASPISPSH